jgi:hypothetical protein
MFMSSDAAVRLAPTLIALQFVAFGWRLNREIAVGDQGRRTWFPLTDWINVAGMLGVVFFAVIRPLWVIQSAKASDTALAIGYVLIAFHPISMAAHYRLWSKEGRSVYTNRGLDYPWLTSQEAVSVILSHVLGLFVGWHTWLSP